MRLFVWSGLVGGVVALLIAVYFFASFHDNFVILFDFVVIGIFLMLAPAGIQDHMTRSKVNAIESRLPDFLRDVAEASKFGSNLADSIVVASEGEYGVLTEDIKQIAAQIEWGVSVDETLEQFEKKYRSDFILKLISTLIECNRSGGNVSEVLNLVAENSKETQLLTKEKYSQLSSYMIVILIAYAVFLLTVIILDFRFFPAMSKQLNSGSSGSFLTFLNLSSIPLIKVIFTGVIILEGVGSGLMAGVLADGRMRSGLFYSAILAAIGYLSILLVGGV